MHELIHSIAEKYDFSIMTTAFINDDNCFLKQVNILIIVFLFFVGWSSQTIFIILLNKDSTLGFCSGVNITSSFNFFRIFFQCYN